MSDFRIIDSAETPIGLMMLCGDGDVVEIRIDELLLMSSVNPVSERLLATRALELHSGDGLRVLVGGLGLGYTAAAVLESQRTREVRVVDRLELVIRWMREGLLPLSEKLAEDRRVALVHGDVYAELLEPGAGDHDLILIDVDHSPARPLDPASLPFYTVEGQRRVAEHLAPGGVLAVWSTDDDEPFVRALEEVYPWAGSEPVYWENEGDDRPYANTLFFARR